MPRFTPRVSAMLGACLLSGCGCDLVGYPAMEISVRDAVTGRPVPLAGATVTSTSGTGIPSAGLRPTSDTTSVLSLCCGAGDWQFRIEQAGYQPFEASLRVPSKGRCEEPVLQRVIARLQPRAGATAPRPQS